ncbi:hypothetical protein EH165_06610 [Nakamurella antarctica]|uniref:Uncharacterized protein n=1 Tax=Nakamurella antarctica TaxID=1902245 RepID=A0A3G8ZW38_9ACTN|nr:PaaX family transcriptional regulator C-terminal domain-containing protein [Nakamurella antarctica]AZI57871.1 hypothetical protein EH165_06610 [Nakamurella antarctica]
MDSRDPWMLVVFSVPEQHRQLRHQIRTELTWLGCGLLAPGVWVGPGHLAGETREVLKEKGLSEHVTIMLGDAPDPAMPLREAVLQWWDFEELSQRYDDFLNEFSPLSVHFGQRADEVFAQHLLVVHAWHGIPYLDPALPSELLPASYRGAAGVALFARLQELLGATAREHVHAVVGSAAQIETHHAATTMEPQ